MPNPVATLRLAGLLLVLQFVLIGVTPAQAQNSRYDITGVVADSSGASVPTATVVALTRADSVLTKFAISGRDGDFRLRRLLSGDYILQISFVGFQTIRQDITVAEADLDVGTIMLEVLVSELDELVISADHIPFRVTKDTLSYNARAFATRPNAVVEDLLRRLPGIEVDEDGSITAQGKTVQNVLVDGKEFFGSDPTIATKNLPADAVETVEVYDKKSDKAEFTGIDDGQEERTINLALREDAKKGIFGSISGGYGGDDTDFGRYDGQASINRFSPKTQLGFVGNANNVNRSSFGSRDFISFSGGAQHFRGSRGGAGIQLGGNLNSGFAETLSLGLNVGHNFTDKTWFRGSYFRSGLDNRQDRVVNQQSVLGSSLSSLTALSSNQVSDNVVHKVNVNAQVTLAEGHDLRIRSDLSFSNSGLTSESFQETFSGDDRSRLQNSADTRYLTNGDQASGSAQLTWRKKLNDAGRSLVLFSSAALNDNEIAADLSSTVGTFNPRTDLMTVEEISQFQSTIGDQLSQTYRISLTEPLEFATVEAYGERQFQDQDEQKSIFDLVNAQPVLNELMSSDFTRQYAFWKGGIRLNRNSAEQLLTVTLEVQNSDLKGKILDRNESVSSGFTHFLPSVFLRRALSESATLQVRYNARTNEPSLTQLQPVADNSDPLNIFVGNPDLEPEYTHNLYSDYRYFNQFSFVNVFASFSSSYTRNQIVQSRTVDEQLRQTITSVNAATGWSNTLRFTYGRPIRPLGLNLRTENSSTHSTGSQLINGDDNDSRIFRHTLSVTLDNRIKDFFDARATARYTYNDLSYSLNTNLNQNYLNSTYRASSDFYLGEAWTVGTALDYRRYDAGVFGSPDNQVLWEASISRLLPNNRTEIELVGRDLLNQNRSVSFSNFSSYVQEERIETLGRYVMLRVTHKLSGLGPGGRGRMGGMGRGPH